MPEQLKPCPACGFAETDDDRFALSYRLATQLICPKCGVYGPTGEEYEDAITAWNSLPRRPDYNDVDCAGCPERRRSALTWTTEPPKVAGWYWHHMPPAFGTVVEYFDPEISEAGCGQWAGPIPTPLEPEES